ncbi:MULTISPECIES: Eco29kI family restriction endonuclease [unclassified Duganella]|uniref:Eco29kI family restriction endonuclease n=1 Tax=unclassified Duganella TaxID=2636909 RepID=UPI00087FF5A8|nr:MULTISPECIES: Eco29kI family restriction endonuclease [unclassified Duganella]SDH48963.1 Eco29kI restriction endonuclease [Duganella sp. OV458]SDK64358.1 Eco29kI restriction endonuclease [Duganella sp. OV510]
MATGKNKDFLLTSLLAELRTLTERIAVAEAGEDARAIKKVRVGLEQVTSQLKSVTTKLDPILRPESIFDPTDPNTSGRVVALTLVAQTKHPLAKIPEFYGAGVYAIYYKGDFAPYAQLKGRDHPIYVGKADPDNQAAKDAVSQGTKLSARLNEHARSIRKAATTLDINDFECRFLIVQTGFQKSAEDYLINFFKPIWNSETKICFGLGKHGDSSDTRGNKRSPWDTMHPGREWASATTENQKAPETIIEQISAHLTEHQPYADIHEIFKRFTEDMHQLDSDRFYTPAHGVVELEAADHDPASPDATP